MGQGNNGTGVHDMSVQRDGGIQSQPLLAIRVPCPVVYTVVYSSQEQYCTV